MAISPESGHLRSDSKRPESNRVFDPTWESPRVRCLRFVAAGEGLCSFGPAYLSTLAFESSKSRITPVLYCIMKLGGAFHMTCADPSLPPSIILGAKGGHDGLA